jgi:hypothetical protein
MPRFTTEQLRVVKSMLPKGGIKTIATKINKSSNLVSQVLMNKRPDLHGIILIASKMAKKNEAKIKKQQEKASQLINSLNE